MPLQNTNQIPDTDTRTRTRKTFTEISLAAGGTLSITMPKLLLSALITHVKCEMFYLTTDNWPNMICFSIIVTHTHDDLPHPGARSYA